MAVPDLLSVVLPTRNRATEVLTAARSVLDQQVDALELVVVDDASTDSTAEVLERLSEEDSRVQVVHNSAPLGPCVARNRGLELATGELVGFCDDDDLWLPHAARSLLDFLKAHPEVGAVSSWHEVFHVELGRAAVFRGPLEYDARQLLWQNLVALPFGVIRRSGLSFEVRFDPDLPTGEDWDLWLRCSSERPMRTLPHVCYRYTQHARPRVTRAQDAQLVGRRNFLTKHRGSMSPSCRLYHETVLAGYKGGRRGMTKALRTSTGYSALQRGYVSMLLASNMASSHVGQRRGDPGLQARLMASMVRGHRRAPVA